MSLTYTKHIDSSLEFVNLEANDFQNTLIEIINKKCDHILINTEFNWDINYILDLLKSGNEIKGLWIVDDNFNLDIIAGLKDWEILCVNVSKLTKGEIDFSNFKQLKFLSFQYANNIKNVEKLENLEFLHCSRWPFENLMAISRNDKLKTLKLDYSRKLLSLKGIEKFTSLKRVDIYSAPNLKSIDDMHFIAESIRFLLFEGCPKIESYNVLNSISSLESLLLAKSTPIESVEFLQNAANLNYAYIGVEVLDRKVDILKEKNIEFKKYKSYL
jgi:hypothetical protein